MIGRFAKRCVDLAGSSVGLVILSPAFLLISILIRLESRGPAFFRQQRAGRKGKLFTLLKFRSMRTAEKAQTAGFQPGNTSRVTTIGHFLRKSKLDELPQLWNVFTGDMSLVGPRPEVPKWVKAFPKEWELVHTVRPGITDPASIAYRDEEALLAEAEDPEKRYREEILPRKLALYRVYVATRSFWKDAGIILMTLWRVIVPKAETKEAK